MATNPTTTIAARLTQEDVARLDRIAALQTKGLLAGKVTRSAVATAAMLRGLGVLEAELDPAPAAPAKKGKAR